MYKKKRVVKKLYWMWRKEKIERGRYLDAKKEFKVLLEKVQKKKRERVENELKNMKGEIEIWKYINKKRGKKQ